MRRIKVRTSDGEVIWVDRGARVKSPPKSTNFRRSEGNPENNVPVQSQEMVDETENDMEITTTEPTIEELLEEEIIDSESEEDKHGTVATAWPLDSDAEENKTDDIRCKLAQWSHDHSISDVAMDDLLDLLKKHNVPNLPESSARLKYYLKSSEGDQADGFSSQLPKNSEKRFEALYRNQRKMSSRQDVLDKRLKLIETHLFKTDPTTTTKTTTAAAAATTTRLPLIWPVDSFETLKHYEARLRREEKGLEQAFRMKFAKAKQTSLETFVNENVRKLLGSTGRWTWTGGSSNSARASGGQPPPTGAASGLVCVKILIDYCEEMFYESNDNVVTEIKRAFKRINEAKKKKAQRHGADVDPPMNMRWLEVESSR